MNSVAPEFRNEEKFNRLWCGYVPPKFSPVHYHRHIEFLIVTEGELKLEIEGRTKILKVGDCAFIFPYVLHSYKVEGNPVRFCATMEPECLGEFGKIMLDYHPKTPFISGKALKKAIPDIQRLMDLLVIEYGRATDPAYNMQQLSHLIHIFSTIIGITGLVKASNKHSLYNDAIKLCCESFAHEGFDTKILAEKLNISESRLRQIFSENMQISPKKYISLLRIEHAQSMLTNTSLPITELSGHCGYGSIRTFNREFASVCGISPSRFREKT